MVKDNKFLHMTVGLPRSGKSTWARKQGMPMVNPDSIRLAMHGKTFYKKLEDLVWYHAGLAVESLFLAGHQDVILDATNLLRHKRDEWYGPWKRIFYVFNTSVEECIKRAIANNQQDLVSVISKMAAYNEPVSCPGETDGSVFYFNEHGYEIKKG